MGAINTVIFLAHTQARRLAAQMCMDVPDWWEVGFYPPRQSSAQQSKYHAQLRDISRQCLFAGEELDEDSWKRLCIDAFAKVRADEGKPLPGTSRLVPSLDGLRVVQLGIQSRDFTKEIASDFIEHLYHFGAEQKVQVIWTQKARPEYIV